MNIREMIGRHFPFARWSVIRMGLGARTLLKALVNSVANRLTPGAPHLHVVFLDGVYAATSDGSLEFLALPRLSTTDVADVLQIRDGTRQTNRTGNKPSERNAP